MIAASAVVLGALGIVSVQADVAVGLTNGGFEEPVTTQAATLVTSSDGIPGWALTGEVDIVTEQPGEYDAHSGNQSVDLVGCAPGTLSTTFDTVAGRTYDVAYWVRDYLGGGTRATSWSVAVTGSTEDVSGPRAFADGHTPGEWAEQALSFVASGSTASVAFTGVPAASHGCVGVLLDDVAVSTEDSPTELTYAGASLGQYTNKNKSVSFNAQLTSTADCLAGRTVTIAVADADGSPAYAAEKTAVSGSTGKASTNFTGMTPGETYTVTMSVGESTGCLGAGPVVTDYVYVVPKPSGRK